MTLCPSCGSVLSLKTAVEVQKERDKLREEVEELKKVVGQLVSSKMRSGESREQVETQAASRKSVLDKLKRHGLAE